MPEFEDAGSACIRLYGLMVRASFRPDPLDRLPLQSCAHPDAVIDTGPVPAQLGPGARQAGPGAEVLAERFRLHVPGVADYLVERGRRITVSQVTVPVAQSDRCRLFLLGPALGAMLIQRGYCVLHGNVVDLDGARIAILGHAASGKSTLATALCQRRATIVSDDVIGIAPDLHVGRAVPWIRLRHSAIPTLGLRSELLQRVRPEGKKAILPLEFSGVEAARPLDRIYIVEPAEVAEPVLDPLAGAQRLLALRTMLYRPGYVQAMERGAQVFSLLSWLSQTTPVRMIRRPINRDSLPGTIRLLTADLKGAP